MVSIIIPVYNVESCLSRCIESIQRQTMQDLEIILVNDGSTDTSGIICDKYALQDKRIRVIHQDNGGQVSARNAGIEIATGEYIAFVDSDDWIESDMISTLYTTAVEKNADVVMEGMIEEIGDKHYPVVNVLSEGIYRTKQEKKYLYENMVSCENYFRLGIQPYLWNKLFRSELVKKYMCCMDRRIRIGEDAAAVFSMLLHSECAVILSSCHYHYCLRSTSIMMQGLNLQKEIESVKALYGYLMGSLFVELEQVALREKTKRYIINNLLTRVYEKLAHIKVNSILFPFVDIKEEDTLIIYGAGALGKAVYRYASMKIKLKIKGWVDGNSEKYQKIGMPVLDIKSLDICPDDKIVVAVFSEKQSQQIKEKLMETGIDEKQIRNISISSEEEERIIEDILESDC